MQSISFTQSECDGERYNYEIFSNINVFTDIEYGENITEDILGTEYTQTLYLDVYVPENDYIIYNEKHGIYWNFTMYTPLKIKLSRKLLESLKEIHDRCIVHGDIKSNNIGHLCRDGTLKLIDLGSSTMMEGKKLVKIDGKYGTEGYMAPEQYNYFIGYKSDIYSVAVVLVEIWCGDIWENGTGYKPCRNEVLKCVRKMEKSDDKQMHDYTKLLRKCLNADMDKRPTSEKFLKAFTKIFQQ